MEYKSIKEDKLYVYDVSYDNDKLKNLLEQLKKIENKCIYDGKMIGKISVFPATKKNIQKRVMSLLEQKKNIEVYPDTITYHKDDFCDYVTYKYAYNKKPYLHDYLDILLNNKSLEGYNNLISDEIDNELDINKKDDLLYAMKNKNQLMINGIINYINSDDLNNTFKDRYNDILAIYKEVLDTLKFDLKYINDEVKEQSSFNFSSSKK